MMKTCLAACIALFPLAIAAQPAADPLDYLGWMKDLAGACWQGTDAAGRVTDRQCYEIQFGHFLRGTIGIGVIDGKPAGFRGDSLFHRDPKTGRIAMVNWANNGAVGRGEALLEGEAIRFLQPKTEGRPEVRHSWTRMGPEAFRVVRERREGETWVEVLVVNYRRAAP